MASPAGEKAIERALELTEPTARAGADLSHGYIDLLAGEELESTGLIQNMMLSRLVPAIYERYWRPALGQLAKGLLGPSQAGEHRIARELLDLEPGKVVLDIACGPGNFTRDFARAVEPGGVAVGIDASPTMLARAVSDTGGELRSSAAYVRGDAIELPFRPQTFDAVCCFAALHLFADPFRAVERMSEVLVPGGRLAILTSIRRRLPVVGVVEPIFGRLSGTYMFEAGELETALTKHGFGDISQRTAGSAQFVGATLA